MPRKSRKARQEVTKWLHNGQLSGGGMGVAGTSASGSADPTTTTSSPSPTHLPRHPFLPPTSSTVKGKRLFVSECRESEGRNIRSDIYFLCGMKGFQKLVDKVCCGNCCMPLECKVKGADSLIGVIRDTREENLYTVSPEIKDIRSGKLH